MIKYTKEKLIQNGKTIENAKIKNVSLTMADHGWLTLELDLSGDGWGCSYGGYCIGQGYLGAKEFKGSPMGIEYIMRIMDTIGVSKLEDLNGKYVRVVVGSWGDPISIIGNIIEDKWFDSKSFFVDYENGDTNGTK